MNFVVPDPDRPLKVCLNVFWFPVVVASNRPLMQKLEELIASENDPNPANTDADFDRLDALVIDHVADTFALSMNADDLKAALHALMKIRFTSPEERQVVVASRAAKASAAHTTKEKQS